MTIWNDAGDVRVAGVQAAKVVAGTGTGTVEVWVAWSDSGITKVGEQTIAQSTWRTITGWTVRTGYPDTTIESDGIRVPAGTYTINAQSYWNNTNNTNASVIRVTLDGTPIPGLEYSEASRDQIRAVTATVTIGAGLVQMQCYCENPISSYRRIQPTDTWLTIENT